MTAVSPRGRSRSPAADLTAPLNDHVRDSARTASERNG